MVRRMFTPKSNAWEHAHQDIPHITLWAAQDPSPDVLRVRDALQELQDMNLPIAAIDHIFEAVKAAWNIGHGSDTDHFGNTKKEQP